MVEAVAVTPDSEFAHASLLARARPKDRHRAGLRLARGEPRKGLCPPRPSRRSPMSVRVSDGGGSPPAFTVAMLALTPDAVDIHPLSVALFDVAQVAAGLGHFSVAPRAACDAALVDVTVRRVHKSQYITAAELPGRPGASSWAAHLHGCTASSRHSTCASGCGGSARAALSVIRERKGDPLPLAPPGRG